MKNYKELSKSILDNAGGLDNISSAIHCYTRLRLNLKDASLAKLDKIKELNVIGAQIIGSQLQIIIGNEVVEVYDAFMDISGLQREIPLDTLVNEDMKINKSKSPKNILSSIIDAIVGCMVPILPALIASGLIKAIVLLATQYNLVASDSPSLATLSFVADSAFYFMPVFIAVFAAKKFNVNIAMAAMLGASLIHPDFIARVNSGQSLSILGLPIYATNYASSVIPAILSVWIMGYVERFFNKYSPKPLRALMVPLCTLLIMIPLTFVVLAPLGAMMSTGFADFLSWFYSTFGIVAIAVFCAITPFVVMLGMHVGTVPISIQSIASTGMDPLILPAFVISNFTQGAACLAVGIKAKTADLKSLAFSSAFSMMVPGISEPGMYGITLRYKTPMMGAMIGAASGGLYFGFAKVGAFSFLPPNLFALAGFVGEGSLSNNLLNTGIGILIGIFVSFVMTMILYKPEEKEN